MVHWNFATYRLPEFAMIGPQVYLEYVAMLPGPADVKIVNQSQLSNDLFFCL